MSRTLGHGPSRPLRWLHGHRHRPVRPVLRRHRGTHRRRPPRPGCSKWTTFPDCIGTFVAESDFGTAPAVLDAVRSRVDNLDLGYTTVARNLDLAESTTRFLTDRYGWELDPAQVGVLPEVLSSLEVTLEHFSRPAPVIVPTPTYMPFFHLLRDHGREIIEVPMLPGTVDERSTWTLDHGRIGTPSATARPC
ncbi:hypothetical protein [uncultured Corynebacterium sp.]|uniref:hypothetical protein n=1 Tax=uncultured Corynebacterium sp. TaxID=159447 RepID=UPI0025988A3B|nr:hypothetical protein [uncultured Corynebacterium sp.]